MKIVSLQAENIKRLVAVEITPDGNMVIIGGRNGQGKTSILDSLWWALAGKDNIQSVPIRDGEVKAFIRLDLGEMVVLRKFSRNPEKQEVTTSISVTSQDGKAKFSSPQAVLDGLLDSLAFDPLAFARMKPADQFAALRKFVPGVDFDKIEAANKADFEARTVLNRKAATEETLAGSMKIDENAPAERVDESELLEKMASASEENADTLERQSNREKAADKIETWRKEATEAQALADKAVEEAMANRETIRVAASAKLAEAKALEDRIKAAGDLPPLVDVREVQAALERAKATNAAVAAREERAAHLKAAEEAKAQAADLTGRMTARNQAREDAVKAAKMPVEGLAFGEGIVLFNNVPFEQASDAEQLKASVAIAMSLNPKLRVIRVRDGSLLDEESLKIVASMAKDNDYQVWIERVGSAEVGFIIEDGHVKGAKIGSGGGEPGPTAAAKEAGQQQPVPGDVGQEGAADAAPEPAPAPAPKGRELDFKFGDGSEAIPATPKAKPKPVNKEDKL